MRSGVSDTIGAVDTLTWLGHATVLMVTRAGTRIIFDPWLEGNPKRPEGVTGVAPLDGIAVTHGHFDHIGSVIPLAADTGAPVICTPEMAAYFTSAGVANVIEMNKGGTIEVGDVELTMVSADHSCGIAVTEGKPHAYGGDPVGFIARPRSGNGDTIYISGDTNVFGDMALIRDLYAPEIGLIPIDGHYNMGPREAAHAVGLLGLNRVVPIHYGTFPVLTGTPDQFARHLAQGKATAIAEVIEPGQSVPLTAKGSH
jgi:L-ascorbate metabolism protein UlaG (beta-lactamase superfamily)